VLEQAHDLPPRAQPGKPPPGDDVAADGLQEARPGPVNSGRTRSRRPRHRKPTHHPRERARVKRRLAAVRTTRRQHALRQAKARPVKKKIPYIDDRAPLQNEPLVLDGVVCLLVSKNYIVTGSVGLDARAMRPLLIRMDTCSGYNLIRPEVSPPRLGEIRGG